MNEFESIEEIIRIAKSLTMRLFEKEEKILKLEREKKELDAKNKQLQGVKNEL